MNQQRKMQMKYSHQLWNSWEQIVSFGKWDMDQRTLISSGLCIPIILNTKQHCRWNFIARLISKVFHFHEYDLTKVLNHWKYELKCIHKIIWMCCKMSVTNTVNNNKKSLSFPLKYNLFLTKSIFYNWLQLFEVCGGSNVGCISILSQCCLTSHPYCHDDNHLPKNIRRSG